jgi:iron complex transport system substrate-binding protein
MIEQLAKWLHPDLFGDLKPEATIAELNDRFLAVPMQGTFWIEKD